jgi:hypothetical protein
MSHSLMRLAAIQIVERKQNLPGLTSKSGFIATEAVKGIIGQIAEPQETTCELDNQEQPGFGLKPVLKPGSSRLCSRHRATRFADPS